MHHPNYDKWSAEEQEWYNNISGKIKKHGHTILGTVDGVIKNSEMAWLNNISNVLEVDAPDV